MQTLKSVLLSLFVAVFLVGCATRAAEPPKPPPPVQKSLYERLGGVFAIAAVVDHFSDALINNPKVGKDSPNPQLREWSRHQLTRLPGLKFERTLWVCDLAGGPQKYAGTVPEPDKFNLTEAHRKLKITPAEFDEVAAELKRTLVHFKVPDKEMNEVLGAFAAHKGEVTTGSKPY